MRALIIYAHPWSGSYNHAILDSVIKGLVEAGTEHELIDLNSEAFNPVLTAAELAGYSRGEAKDPKVKEYQKKIDNADYLIVIHPVWWTGLPAILKGFLDKVLLKGWAYDVGLFGTLKGRIKNIRKAIVVSTMNAPGWFYGLRMGNVVRHELINGSLKSCGIKNVSWVKLSSVATVKKETRDKWLNSIRELTKSLKAS